MRQSLPYLNREAEHTRGRMQILLLGGSRLQLFLCDGLRNFLMASFKVLCPLESLVEFCFSAVAQNHNKLTSSGGRFEKSFNENIGSREGKYR